MIAMQPPALIVLPTDYYPAQIIDVLQHKVLKIEPRKCKFRQIGNLRPLRHHTNDSGLCSAQY